MPRKPNKKKMYKKRRNIGRPPSKPLGAPRPYLFKRHSSSVQGLSPANSYWTSTGNNLGRTFKFQLNNLGDSTDYTNLFKYYRLKGARIRLYFSNTGSLYDDVGNKSNNGQLMVTIDRNTNGLTTANATEATYLQSQTCKRRLALGGDRKPIDIYMPLKQSNIIYDNPDVTSDETYSLINPKWVGTYQPDVQHYGFNIMVQRVDGQPFTDGVSNMQYVRVLTTVYLECKKVS